MPRVRPFPKNSLEESLVIPKAIQDKSAGKPMKKLLLADAIGRKPASTAYVYLLSSSYKYGLTIGTEKADYISLSELGLKITRPKSEEERDLGLREAALKPDLFERVYRRFDDAKFPSGQFFQNTLEQEFGVPRALVVECEKLLIKNGRFVGLIRDISGSPHIMIEGAIAQESTEAEQLYEPGEVPPGVPEAKEAVKAPPLPSKPKDIFIAHGKSKKPLEQLKGILSGFKVPHKVAIDEPHKGRPISEKVVTLMRECGAGIFIFTADEESTDANGNKVWKPSDNVVFELGAGIGFYGDKIVILREEGVVFGSDFTAYGHITFEKDKLDAKGVDLIKELIGLGIIEFTVT